MEESLRKRYRKKGGRHSKVSDSQKRQIALIVLKENISLINAATRFGVSKTTISNWVHQYFSDIEQTNVIEIMKDTDAIPIVPSERMQEYEEKLHQAQLKISALETLIELAEDTYKIAIRKNSGTKQHG
jgi:transposase